MTRSIVLSCAAALALATPVIAADSPTSGTAMTYDLTAQNGSGETGTVALEPAGKNATKVTVAITGASAGVAEPVHIHDGTCAHLNPVPKYPLANVVDGHSTTTVKVPIAALTSGGYAVNVHKSTDDLKTYVACTDLGSASTASPAPSTSPQ